jgi:hypothetical protein
MKEFNAVFKKFNEYELSILSLTVFKKRVVSLKHPTRQIHLSIS